MRAVLSRGHRYAVSRTFHTISAVGGLFRYSLHRERPGIPTPLAARGEVLTQSGGPISLSARLERSTHCRGWYSRSFHRVLSLWLNSPQATRSCFVLINETVRGCTVSTVSSQRFRL